MRQGNDPFYVPDQLTQQIEDENKRRQMQKNKLMNEQREFYQEYLKRKNINKQVDIPSFKIGQENPLPRRPHRTVDELNNNVCVNLTKDNVYTQQRRVDQISFNKRHEKDNRNYNIINMAPSGKVQDQYNPRIVDDYDIGKYEDFRYLNEKNVQEMPKPNENQYDYINRNYGNEEMMNRKNEYSRPNIPRTPIANPNENNQGVILSDEERNKAIAYLEYLKQEEMKMKELILNDKEPINDNNQYQHHENDNEAMREPNQIAESQPIHQQQIQPQVLPQTLIQSQIPTDHYHFNSLDKFKQDPNLKLVDNPYVENHQKISNYYQNQRPISSYHQPKPPYGVDNDDNSQSSSLSCQRLIQEKIKQNQKLDLQEEARREYMSNMMKNVNTHTNLTHMTSLNPSLKSQEPMRAPITYEAQTSAIKLKQQQYKELLDNQIQSRPYMSPSDRLNNPYSNQKQIIGESCLENNPIARPYTAHPHKKNN